LAGAAAAQVGLAIPGNRQALGPPAGGWYWSLTQWPLPGKLWSSRERPWLGPIPVSLRRAVRSCVTALEHPNRASGTAARGRTETDGVSVSYRPLCGRPRLSAIGNLSPLETDAAATARRPFSRRLSSLRPARIVRGEARCDHLSNRCTELFG